MSARTTEEDGERLSEICREHYESVFRLCLATLRSEHDAADATQLTFERILRRVHDLEVGQHFDRYVLRTARFACVDVARARTRATSDAAELRCLEAAAAPTLTDVSVVSKDTCDLILSGVSDEQRDLLVEREMLGRDVSEMASRRDRGARSLSVALHRARRAAARYAIANDLRGLLPVGGLSAWWLRVRDRVDQLAHTPGIGIAAVGLVALTLAPAGPAPDGGGSGSASAPLHVAVTPVSMTRQVAPTRTVDVSRAMVTTAPLPSAPPVAAIGDDPGPSGSDGIRLPVDRVPLPGPVGTIHQDRPEDPKHRYGISAAGTEVVTIETDEQGDELTAIDEPLCSTIGAAPGGHCTTGE